MPKLHHFDPEIAEEIGVNAAIIYESMVWALEHKATEQEKPKLEYNIKNYFIKGQWWVYNSVDSIGKRNKYLGKKAISNALAKLVSTDFLRSGEHNKKKYDKTKWYCLGSRAIAHLSKGQRDVFQADIETINNPQSPVTAHFPKREIDLPKRGNGFTPKGKPIPLEQSLEQDFNIKDNAPKNGTIKISAKSTPLNDPKNGTQNQSVEPVIEPENKKTLCDDNFNNALTSIAEHWNAEWKGHCQVSVKLKMGKKRIKKIKTIWDELPTKLQDPDFFKAVFAQAKKTDWIVKRSQTQRIGIDLIINETVFEQLRDDVLQRSSKRSAA